MSASWAAGWLLAEMPAGGAVQLGWAARVPRGAGKLGHCGAHVSKGSELRKALGGHVAPPRYTCGFGGKGRHTASAEALGSKPSPLHKLLTTVGGDGCSACSSSVSCGVGCLNFM